jgi:RNA polymerase sigma-70 factor (ECF subfamily)
VRVAGRGVARVPPFAWTATFGARLAVKEAKVVLARRACGLPAGPGGGVRFGVVSVRRASKPAWLRPVPAAAPDAARAPAISDDALIEAVVRGDDAIAGHLYDRLVSVVDRTLYRVFGRREPDHDDLVQATFEQIVLTLTRRRFAGACSLNTWASTVASHVGLNALRSRRRERKVLEWGEDVELNDARRASGRDAEHEAGVRDQIERVRRHLAEMDPPKATTLFLHDVLGHDLAEIAVMTGVSVAAAQSRLVRGRRELLGRLADDGILPRRGGPDDA